MTFIIYGKKNSENIKVFRLTVPVAVAKARQLAEDGWDVSIGDFRGNRHYLPDFDTLLFLDQSRTRDLGKG